MKRILHAVIVVLIISACGNSSEIFKITLGSCNDQNDPQVLWNDIAEEESNLWIWLGDNIYADTEDMGAMKRAYQKQLNNPAYSSFKESIEVIGTWDDHDYGVNDGDRTYEPKAESRDLALEFLGVDKQRKIWDREGMYQSYEYSIQGVLLRVILLDTRYWKDPIARTSSGYVADPSADLLGKDQWDWLENELKKKEDVLIIANGTQVIPEDHKYEKWANFPSSRQRFFDLLDQEKTERILLVSGDRHLAEISKIDLKSKTVYELTTSGMTHSYDSVGEEKNIHRIGELYPQLNYGVIKVKSDKSLELEIKGQNGFKHLSLSF